MFWQCFTERNFVIFTENSPYRSPDHDVMTFYMSCGCVGNLAIDLLSYPLFLLPKQHLKLHQILSNLFFCNPRNILDAMQDVRAHLATLGEKIKQLHYNILPGPSTCEFGVDFFLRITLIFTATLFYPF